MQIPEAVIEIVLSEIDGTNFDEQFIRDALNCADHVVIRDSIMLGIAERIAIRLATLSKERERNEILSLEAADLINSLKVELADLCADYQLMRRGPCCREPWCEGECTCEICAPDVALRELKAQYAKMEAQHTEFQQLAVKETDSLKYVLNLSKEQHLLAVREVDGLREQLRVAIEDRDRDRRTMDYWEKSYLAEHEHWGACKWKAQVAEMSKPAIDALCMLAERTEGESRALVEVLSCRLGLGHVADILASRVSEASKPTSA